MRRGWWYLLGIAAAIGLLLALVWPMVEREMMRDPIMRAVDAVRAADVDALQECFTADAEVTYSRASADGNAAVTVPVETMITLLQPHMISGELRGSAHVGDLENLTYPEKGRVVADVTITFFIEGNEDLPYRSIPVRRSGRIELRRIGFLTYQIRRISTDAREFQYRLQ